MLYRNIYEEELKLDTGTGYLYFIDKNCPIATGNSYRVYYHRYIMSISMNRWLTTEEIVHHIDENKLNNCLHNLQILDSSEHGKIHAVTLSNKECKNCSNTYKPKASKQKFCGVNCARTYSGRHSSHITKELIEYWVINFSWVRASKELGLSDNGLRKKYKSLTGLDPKTIKLNNGE